jgi:biotin operon repressor
MRTQRRTTVIVVGGALAIASVGYGLGTQAGDGTAVADGAQSRNGGAALPFERGAPPGLSDLANTLGVDQDKLDQAFRDFHDQHEGDRHEEFSAALAKALGISADKVTAAFDALHPKGEARPMEGGPPPGLEHRNHALPLRQLANRLGVTRADLRKAFNQLRPDGPGRGFEKHEAELAKFLADRFNVDVDKVSEALAANRPPLRSEHRGGLPDHPPAP